MKRNNDRQLGIEAILSMKKKCGIAWGNDSNPGQAQEFVDQDTR
jgi:hypothetical protein